MKSIKRLILISFSLIVAFALSAQAEDTTLKIVDENGAGIEGASVLVGEEKQAPEISNILVSDENGEIIIPESWDKSLPLTVSATGFIVRTFANQNPESQTLKMNVADGSDMFEIKGDTTGYGRLRTDGFVDFSLVIPALTRDEIINFDLSMVVSPVTDVLNVGFGQRFDVPSNLSIPKQRERYIINLTLNKPTFRAFVRRPGDYNLFASHGKFPMKKVADQLRKGTSLFEVINEFDFLGGGQKQIKVTKSIDKQDISIDQMKFDQDVKIIAPKLPADREMVSLSMVDDNGQFFPADVKRAKSEKTLTLKYPPNQAKAYALSVLAPKEASTAAVATLAEGLGGSEEFFEAAVKASNSQNDMALNQLSIAMQELNVTSEALFLPVVDEPVLTKDQLTFVAPATTAGLIAKSTLVVLSEVEDTTSGKVPSEKKTRIWEYVSAGWISAVDLPAEAQNLDPNKTYRWEVLFLARSEADSSLTVGTGLTEGVTHITRNSLDIN